MTPSEYPLHSSQRGWFGRALYFEMQANPDIFLLTGDLGFGLFDLHQRDFPGRFINCGAAECGMVGAAVGLSISGKKIIPFCYSITPFLLYRPFEWLRNLVNHERIPVRLVGSGLDFDYGHDGITHHACDAKKVLALLPAIVTYFPETPEAIQSMLRGMIERDEPSFICLRR